MEATAILTYMTTLAVLTAAPGPLVAVLAARSANKDRRGACALAFGICAGDIAVILAISMGLGFWLQAHPELFAAAKYVGAGYLLWMARRMWGLSRVAADHPAPVVGPAASMITGFAICLSSPQTLVLYLVLLPRVVDLTAIQFPDTALLIVATALVLVGVFLSIILLAGATQRLLRSSIGVVLWGRSMSLAVALSAIWVVFS